MLIGGGGGGGSLVWGSGGVGAELCSHVGKRRRRRRKGVAGNLSVLSQEGDVDLRFYHIKDFTRR